MKILVWADNDRIPEARVQANLYAAENGESNPSIFSREARRFSPDDVHEPADVVVVQAGSREIVEAYAHQEEILEPGTDDPLYGPCDVVIMQFEDDDEEEEPEEEPQDSGTSDEVEEPEPEEEGAGDIGDREASEEASDSEGSEEEIGEEHGPEEGGQEAAEEEEAEEAAEDPWEDVNATDAAVALARGANLTPAQVTGTGEDGRILKGDVEAAIEAQE